MKYNDNLTDLMEHLDKDQNEKQESPANKAWEVTNDDGELIKLDDFRSNNRPEKF